MQVLFGCILVSVAHCNVLRLYPIRSVATARNGATNTFDQVDSYVELANKNSYGDELNMFSQFQQTYLDRLQPRLVEETKPPNYRQTAYLLVKTTKQRDKRYINYLTLCHFKICNMGRKRTTRYFHLIRTMDGNGDV